MKALIRLRVCAQSDLGLRWASALGIFSYGVSHLSFQMKPISTVPLLLLCLAVLQTGTGRRFGSFESGRRSFEMAHRNETFVPGQSENVTMSDEVCIAACNDAARNNASHMLTTMCSKCVQYPPITGRMCIYACDSGRHAYPGLSHICTICSHNPPKSEALCYHSCQNVAISFYGRICRFCWLRLREDHRRMMFAIAPETEAPPNGGQAMTSPNRRITTASAYRTGTVRATNRRETTTSPHRRGTVRTSNMPTTPSSNRHVGTFSDSQRTNTSSRSNMTMLPTY